MLVLQAGIRHAHGASDDNFLAVPDAERRIRGAYSQSPFFHWQWNGENTVDGTARKGSVE